MSDFYLLNALTPKQGGFKWIMVEKYFSDGTTKVALQGLTDEGFLERVEENWSTRYKVTTKGHELMDRTSREAKLELIGKGPSTEAERALWAWLLINGGAPEYYGGIKHHTAKQLHLAACGLDFDKCSPVESESWSSFEGTFAENGTDSGIGGRASCQCGMVTGTQVVTQHYSIAQILEGALSL